MLRTDMEHGDQPPHVEGSQVTGTGDPDDGERIDDRERQRLLDATRRQSGTIGDAVPEELEVRGSTIDLREFVMECRRLDAIPEAQREAIEAVKTDLRRERLARKQEIEDGDVTRAEAERLVESVRGIDRALNALEGLDTPSFAEQVRRHELEQARELQALVDWKRELDAGGKP